MFFNWKRKCEELILENEKLREEIVRYKDDSGEVLIDRLTELARKCKLDTHSEEYQQMMHRVFMDIGGRESPVLKAYSKTSFLKDTPEELMDRLKKLKEDASIITKQIEDKAKVQK